MKTPIPVSDPLATAGRVPVLFGALGASFHLESLLPDDEARLERANEIVLDWFGAELSWTLNSGFGLVERFRHEDLDYVSAHASTLAAPEKLAGDPELFDSASLLLATKRSPFGIACHGGERPNAASPYSYRFYSEIPGVEAAPYFPTRTILRITVPMPWPLDDFQRRVLEIGAQLRLRWGAAGLMYSAWETQFHTDAMKAIYMHARRYPGYDVGLYVAWMEDFYSQLRTVNWLTVLGPPLQQKLASSRVALPESDDLVTVFRSGDLLVLRAGPQPEAGDINRLQIPAAYVRADEMVRPVRARQDVSFYESWTEATTAQWLCRFEKRFF